MVRQEDEAIRIRESSACHSLNSKSEFHQPSNIRLVPASGISLLSQEGQIAPIIDRAMYANVNRSEHSCVDSPVVPMWTRSKGMVSSIVPIQTVSTTRAQRNASNEHPSKYSRNDQDGWNSCVAKSTNVPSKQNSPSTVQHGSKIRRTAPVSASGNSKGINSDNDKKQKIKSNISSMNTVKMPKSSNIVKHVKTVRRRRLSRTNLLQHDILNGDMIVLSELPAKNSHVVLETNNEQHIMSPEPHYDPVSPTPLQVDNGGEHNMVQSSQWEQVSPTTLTQSMATIQPKISNVTNMAKSLHPTLSQIYQITLSQYVKNTSRIVAKVTSKSTNAPNTPANTVVRKKQAEYKHASPPSPPSFMNTTNVIAQVHTVPAASVVQSDPNMGNNVPSFVEGTWSSWAGTSTTNTVSNTPHISQNQRFQRSDVQAMADLFLLRLDQQEKEEEKVRNAVKNPIRTTSAYNAFLSKWSNQAPVNTLSEIVQTSHQINFRKPVFPKKVIKWSNKSTTSSKVSPENINCLKNVHQH